MTINITSHIERLVQKIIKMHDFILESYYVNTPNLKFGEYVANDVALFSIMTSLLNRNQLFLGNVGLGKTTTAEAVSSLLYKLPIEFVEAGTIHGHPMLTEEKITGRLDFSKLSEQEKVIFSIFAQTPSARIIDEVNRIPEGVQNYLLNCVETGLFSYLNDAINQGKPAFFATANYKDNGNTELLTPLLDRFDVSVEVMFPLFKGSFLRGDLSFQPADKQKLIDLLRNDYQEELFKLNESAEDEDVKEKNLIALKAKYEHDLNNITSVLSNSVQRMKLSDRQLTGELRDIVTDKTRDFPTRLKLIKAAVSKNGFHKNIEDLAISASERTLIPYLIVAQGYEKEASLLIDAFFDSCNAQLKINGDVTNHNQNYVIGQIQNNPGVRSLARSTHDYSRLLSILKGESKVSVETVKTVLPYVINHKLTFSDNFTVTADAFSGNSLQMNKAREIVKDFIKNDFLLNKDKYEEMYGSLRTKTREEFCAKYDASDIPIVKRFIREFKQ